jgi:hypothetical protein
LGTPQRFWALMQHSCFAQGFIARLGQLLSARLHAAGGVVGMAAWLASLLLLMPVAARAELAVSGAIEANTRWALAQSPVVIKGDLSVNGGATLSIDAGVQVYVVPGARIAVQSGAILASGSGAQPVVIQSDKVRQGQAGAAGDWGPVLFSSGGSASRFEHVQILHGKGIVLDAASPVLNYVELSSHVGPAITTDLVSSPAGVGLKATACGLNGIAVPAGDITGSVKWGLRGIPYVVSSGLVSVGASPALTSVSPASVEQGQTVNLTFNGARLGGLGSVAFNKSGLSVTPFSGGSSTQAFVQLKVAADAPLGAAGLSLKVDAGELALANAITVTPPLPAITALEPATVLAGAGVTQITVRGRNFLSSSEVLFNAASVPTTLVSATELRATLPNQTAIGNLQTQVRSPDPQKPGQYLTSAQVALAVQAPVPPVLTLEPSPIALPPDGKPHEITVRLSKADYRDNTISLSLSDPAKGTVSPATLVIPAGQTVGKITVTPGTTTGTVNLVVDSATIARVTVPLFITADFRGVNTSYAQPVGVVVQVKPGQVTRDVLVANNLVGVSVGAVVTQVSPAAMVLGSSANVIVSGKGLPTGAQMSFVPSTGLTLGAVTEAADGSNLQFKLDVAQDAAVGMRRVVVKDAAGKLLTFADPARAALQIMYGLPQIDSVDPIVAAKGAVTKLVIRGRNLQQAQVSLVPAAGVRLDAQPVISADGTTITTYADVSADAASGQRAVQVITPAGATAAEVSAYNGLSIVSTLRNAVTPITSPIVGVMVGATRAADPVNRHVGGNLVGVLLGAGVASVAPKTGIIGSDVEVTVSGAGLGGITTVSLVPSAGVTVLSGPTATADGKQMTFKLRVDPAAATGLRRLVLNTATGLPVTYAQPQDGVFLVSAPIPELYSVTPPILVSGQGAVRMTLRGRNLGNTSAVRIDSPEGMTVAGPFDAAADGSSVSFTVSAAAGAVSGQRAVIVTTPAGESSATLVAGNMVRVAATLGNSYSGIASQVVGVQIGSNVVVKPTVDSTLASPVIGVLVGSAKPPVDPAKYISASAVVGVVSGSFAQAIAPRGWLQGSSGNLVVTGQGLGAVTSVTVKPDTGVLMGAPEASADQRSLSISISVAPDAPLVQRELRLQTASGQLVFTDASVNRIIGIGKLPNLTSMSPILIEQGKGVTLSVRGTDLQGVTGVTFEPASGLNASPQLSWSKDALGELLTISVSADQAAALGNRALVLQVPGGQTSSVAVPANTLKVITPQ